MNLVTLENISHHYSERILFDHVNLLINDSDRIGLIGPNGSGKSTLLRILAGLETAVSGTRTVWGGVKIHYISQEPILDESLTVLETVFQSDAPQIQRLKKYEAATLALNNDPNNSALQEKLIQLSNEMDEQNGWTAEAEAKTILTQLGIPLFDTKIKTLSGGQRKRVALAQGLITPTSLLILDEPTNHIDAETVAWLETYLAQMNSALLLVTHDRYFLDRVVNRIIELEQQTIVSYSGNYGSYLEQRANRDEQMAVKEDKRQALLKRELAWLNRGAQARTTKQKARVQRVDDLQKIGRLRPDRKVAMALASRRLGKNVLEAKNLSKSYEALTLFENLDFMLNPHDRIGVVGPNGAGKTTFLDVLTQKIRPDSGEIKWGETVQIGYYDQHSAHLNLEKTVLDFIEDAAPVIRTNDGERVEAAQMLEWFLFPRPQQRAKISSLSGGEKRRLYLLYTLIHQPNVLILDEPTNDLDIQTLGVLEEFLDHFKGCLIAVSHDRYFLDRNVDFLINFEGGKMGTRYPTPFDSFMKAIAEQKAPTTVKQKPLKSQTKPKSKKLSFNEKNELASLDKEMPLLEAKIVELETAVNQSATDYQKLEALVPQLEEAKEALELAELRWLELMEKVES